MLLIIRQPLTSRMLMASLMWRILWTSVPIPKAQMACNDSEEELASKTKIRGVRGTDQTSNGQMDGRVCQITSRAGSKRKRQVRARDSSSCGKRWVMRCSIVFQHISDMVSCESE